MDQSVHFVTVSITDLDAARAFYVAGLGWQPLLDVPDEILFFQIAPGVVLGLFEATKFNADLATGADHAAVSGLTLSHNVDSPADVRSAVVAMERSGGTVLKAPQEGAFGGVFHAHVQDPNGVIWEVAHNPHWSVGDDGVVRLGGP